MNPPLLYLSGPMTGLPSFNNPAFDAAAAALRALGWRVYNPAENRWVAAGVAFPLREGFAEYSSVICLDASGLVLLPGWEASLGATAEFALARAVGIPARLLEDVLAGGSVVHDGEAILARVKAMVSP